MRDLDALRVFEVAQPGHTRKQAAFFTLLQAGVAPEGIRAMIEASPWPYESKRKWLANLKDLARKTRVCPFCEIEGPEEDCPVGAYMAAPDRMPEEWL